MKNKLLVTNYTVFSIRFFKGIVGNLTLHMNEIFPHFLHYRSLDVIFSRNIFTKHILRFCCIPNSLIRFCANIANLLLKSVGKLLRKVFEETVKGFLLLIILKACLCCYPEVCSKLLMHNGPKIKAFIIF